MTKIDENKYVTYNREALRQALADQAFSDGEITELEEELEIKDAVVIRKSDRLAVPAFESYANAAVTVGEILKDTAPGTYDLDSLIRVADYFMRCAAEARTLADHLPTP